ncbi:MAG: efflux RND transporter periplasmic adaptor subunit [Gemmatimonadetes bacterium]|nr:efflux RND transporter periplasmic adaptor subunit [Gemmatimonadota bacterium]
MIRTQSDSLSRIASRTTVRIALTSAIVIAAACGGADAAPASEDKVRIPVRVVTAESRRTMPPIVLTGTLGAKEEIPLAFKVGGVVARVAVEAGQSVTEGQVLAELSLAEIDAQVSAAREGRDKAQRDLTRAERLLADSVATRSQVEDARTQLDVTSAQLRAAEFNRQYAVIRAPASGIVLRRQLEVGQLVGPNTQLIVLRTERRGLVLRAAAADRDAVRLKAGETARIAFDAFPGREFTGRIERVGVSAMPTTGTYEVEIAVQAGDQRLASGLIGRASMSPRAATAMPMIPAEALLEVDGAAASVFVLDETGDAVHRIAVRVAFLDGPMAAISAGLPPNARVVTAGATRLTEGAKVTVSAERAP